MLKFIYNIYYRLYLSIVFLGEEWTPRFNAVVLMSFFFLLNCMTAHIFIYIAMPRFNFWVGNAKYYFVLIYFIFVIMNYYLILYKKKFVEIEKRHAVEDKKLKLYKNRNARIYCISSIILFASSLYNMK